MLVLSRRPSEKIVFPNLGITVEVLQVGGRLTKLGISAPDSVKILRAEVADTSSQTESPRSEPQSAGLLQHQLRNRLNTIGLRLHLIQKQLEIGVKHQASDLLTEVLRELRALDAGLTSSADNSDADENHSVRLLVVDDDDNERELLAGLLQLHGYHVDTAVDGADALEYLSTHKVPDCVLLDLDMPRVDGHRTILSIRSDRRCRDARVFAVSGKAPSEDSTPAGLKGFDAWFSKPLDPSKLIGAISAAAHSVTHEVA